MHFTRRKDAADRGGVSYLNTGEGGILKRPVGEVVGLGVHHGQEEVPEAPPLENEGDGFLQGTASCPAPERATPSGGAEEAEVDHAQ